MQIEHCLHYKTKPIINNKHGENANTNAINASFLLKTLFVPNTIKKLRIIEKPNINNCTQDKTGITDS